MQHPSMDILSEHASGNLDLAHRVVVEAHLELCSVCREEMAALVAPGGRLLSAAGREDPPIGLWEKLESRLTETELRDPLPSSIPLPPAARRELPADVRPRWWRLFLGGARMAHLATDPASGAHLVVAQMPGGLVFPRHEHLGYEHAVVLSGGYEDERGEFLAGDYAEYGPGSEHGPHTLDGDPCWILFRLEGNVRFRGWRGRLQRLFG